MDKGHKVFPCRVVAQRRRKPPINTNLHEFCGQRFADRLTIILLLLSACAFGSGAIASKRNEDGGEKAGMRASVEPFGSLQISYPQLSTLNPQLPHHCTPTR